MREAGEKFVRTALAPEGVRTISFVEEQGATADSGNLELTRADIKSISVPEPTDEDATTTTETRHPLLKIVSAQFDQGYKWRFTDGDNIFTATMDDGDFVKRLDASEVVLSKIDALRCRIEQTQTLSGPKLKTDTRIVEVEEHISGARQLRLL